MKTTSLRVFNTRQLYTYDYKLVQDTNATMLVYGWKLDRRCIFPPRATPGCSMAPTAQTNTGTRHYRAAPAHAAAVDRRYTLPSACVGAAVYDNAIYAFSDTYLYKTDINTQQFYAYEIPAAKDGARVTQLPGPAGRRTGCWWPAATSVYSVTLPELSSRFFLRLAGTGTSVRSFSCTGRPVSRVRKEVSGRR